MATKVRVDGLRELERALAELPKATGKNVLRRVLLKRGQPVADAMRAMAPVDDGHLKKSITVSTTRPVGHKSEAARAFATAGGGAAGRAAAKAAGSGPVEVFVGPGRHPQAIFQEFGTINHGPQPFARPGWDQTKNGVLEGLKDDLWAEVKKAADRLAKKQARLAAKGG
jgi:HK97 gp10 family phage protein